MFDQLNAVLVRREEGEKESERDREFNQPQTFE